MEEKKLNEINEQNVQENLELEETSQPDEPEPPQSGEEKELEAIIKEGSEFKEKYFRALADQENARKRLQKERQENSQYIIQSIIAEFLNPIDHLERALEFTDQMSEEMQNWAYGFKMILNQMKEILENHGVVAIEAFEKPFDPHLHEAVEMLETDEYPPGTVVKVSVKGYRLGERVIRPARVSVSKASPQQEEK